MAGTDPKRYGWSMERDEEGHRIYTLTVQIRATDKDDGPAVIFNTPNTPLVGDAWNFGNDDDPWAFCWPDMRIRRQHDANEPGFYWLVDYTFTTKPLNRCQDQAIENPLNEPAKISGGYSKFTKQAAFNRDGSLIRNSAWEPIKGPEAEFDDNRPNVRISMNVPSLPLALFASMVDTVNDSPLWGLPARTIKLSNVHWERLLYGTCTFYWNVSYEFDINYNTFDRIAADYGTRKLVAGGDKDNPSSENWEVIKEGKGENTGGGYLDGNGNLATSLATAGQIPISYYNQSNFLLLGVPGSLV